ncbi:hypothetical protein COX08_01825 [Candidatus Beckwithbacteria bacterium CG23_combo_of_CG06-09_8_20_14_all_34_8]|uniref:Uncharacterized protein n=1 Tax=Candidatus Beckwithbacteria bacterium CG23_combo_of_CG06-09_8_20_14_all_34_8 TaxID=1974497 RepID=A0A2H0B6J2_9BACT|nr:MAG: hypothetical protein COX08_01825 [Candidatus Beckwithbacteria bacterium CG23_combo_of_CG06-09_8_20_14_all_34_8]
MKIYLFGNPNVEIDKLSFTVADKLKPLIPSIEFISVKPNEDIPFDDKENVFIMDTIMGITKVTLITENDLDKFQLPPRFSAHDFDLGFQLKYLKKLGKIKTFTIIGLPMNKKIDINLVVNKIKTFT